MTYNVSSGTPLHYYYRSHGLHKTPVLLTQVDEIKESRRDNDNEECRAPARL